MQRREYLIAIAVGIVVVVCGRAGLFAPLDARINDSFVSPKPVNSDIVIVAIDDESLQSIGQWPWNRAVFGKFLDGLAINPPKAVGIDVMFAEKSRAGIADDQKLIDSIDRFNQTIDATIPTNEFGFSDVSAPPIVFAGEGIDLSIKNNHAFISGTLSPLFGDGVYSGLTNIIVDGDGVVRRVPLIAWQGSDFPYASLAFSTLSAMGLVDGLSYDDETIARIVYAQPTGGIRRIPFVRALEEPELLKDKIVLVGATTADLHDEQRTPVDRGTLMPGVEIQANIVNMLVQGYSLNDVPYAQVIAFVLALVPAFFFMRFRRSIEPLVASIVFVALIVVTSNILFDRGFVVPAFEFVVSSIVSSSVLFIYRYAKNRKQTRAMYDAFGRYVSPSVLREILRHPERVEFGGAERVVSVLFCDIRSFTTLSESMPASELVELLNRYFSVMSKEITSMGGTIDKYIGDAIMAFWGAPLDDADHAEHAVRAAIGMTQALERFNVELVSEGKAPLAIGIGIASGDVVVGNIGSLERLDYTAMGDTVNTASRLEGLTKEHKQSIIISDSTKQMLPADIETVEIGEVSVKGKTQMVRIHGVR